MATISVEHMENMDLDALWIDEEEEEGERRKREPLGRRNRNTAAKKKKKAEAKSDCKVGKTQVDASSRPAAAKADLARVKKSHGEVEASGSRKKTTEVDLVAAAVYKAEVEAADRKQQKTALCTALKKWVLTGDPEARLYHDRWIAEMVEAIRNAGKEDWDPRAVEAQQFRDFWIHVWSRTRGSFEDNTAIGPMRFTDKKPGPYDQAETMETLQFFSARVVEIKEEIEWPLNVFGIIAARDCLDHNRNIIFDRKRDDCQTITKENPYLTLTGPTRAVLLSNPASIEVVLRVKGITESEDKDLSYLVVWHELQGASCSHVIKKVITSKLSTLELTYGHIICSVEATISVKVIGAKLPDGFRGALTANTTSINANTTNINARKVLLLAFGDDETPAADDDDDGTIRLSRCVVCVELGGELRVSVKAQCDEGQVVEEDFKVFKPKKASRSCDVLQVCSCKMEVTVAWSLLSDH